MIPIRPTAGETARILVLSLIDAVGDAFDAAGRGLDRLADGIGGDGRERRPQAARAVSSPRSARPCDYCDGARLIPTGHVMDTEPCPRCGGSGIEPPSTVDGQRSER